MRQEEEDRKRRRRRRRRRRSGWADFNVKRAEQSALLAVCTTSDKSDNSNSDSLRDQPPEQIQDPPVLVKVEDVSVVQNTLNARQALRVCDVAARKEGEIREIPRRR
eukprot:756248-Hanusia_phi.AAC.1